jgi:hypothetical protein
MAARREPASAGGGLHGCDWDMGGFLRWPLAAQVVYDTRQLHS